ncbi:Aryl hydrocarbon receptor nuclear translocator-like protein 1, partial [Stegodyphus mimosarum]
MSTASGVCKSENNERVKAQPARCKVSAQPSASTRLQRNQAEKQRRDRLNGYISELATLVPMVANASKPLDKVSILRLAAAQMRLNFSCLNPKRFKSKSVVLPPSVTAYLDVIEKTIGGFVIVTTFSGVIVFCSRCVEDYIGYQNIDIMGNSIYNYIHSGDVSHFEKKVNSVINRKKKKPSKKRTKIVKAHMQQRPLPRSGEVRYRKMVFKISVHINEVQENVNTEPASTAKGKKLTRTKDFGTTAVVLMFIEPVKLEPEIDISYIEAHQDAYFTIHGLQAEIIYADQRISTITGYMPNEVQGTSAYQYICSSDVPIAIFAQKAMFTSSDGTGIITYRLRIRDMRYVYLQSSGQIAYKDSTNEISHFVCFNKLLSDKEGSEELKKFQQRFAPQIIAAKMMDVKKKSHGQIPEVELKDALSILTDSLPSCSKSLKFNQTAKGATALNQQSTTFTDVSEKPSGSRKNSLEPEKRAENLLSVQSKKRLSVESVVTQEKAVKSSIHKRVDSSTSSVYESCQKKTIMSTNNNSSPIVNDVNLQEQLEDPYVLKSEGSAVYINSYEPTQNAILNNSFSDMSASASVSECSTMSTTTYESAQNTVLNQTYNGMSAQFVTVNQCPEGEFHFDNLANPRKSYSVPRRRHSDGPLAAETMNFELNNECLRNNGVSQFDDFLTPSRDQMTQMNLSEYVPNVQHEKMINFSRSYSLPYQTGSSESVMQSLKGNTEDYAKCDEEAFPSSIDHNTAALLSDVLLTSQNGMVAETLTDKIPQYNFGESLPKLQYPNNAASLNKMAIANNGCLEAANPNNDITTHHANLYNGAKYHDALTSSDLTFYSNDMNVGINNGLHEKVADSFNDVDYQCLNSVNNLHLSGTRISNCHDNVNNINSHQNGFSDGIKRDSRVNGLNKYDGRINGLNKYDGKINRLNNHPSINSLSSHYANDIQNLNYDEINSKYVSQVSHSLNGRTFAEGYATATKRKKPDLTTDFFASMDDDRSIQRSEELETSDISRNLDGSLQLFSEYTVDKKMENTDWPSSYVPIQTHPDVTNAEANINGELFYELDLFFKTLSQPPNAQSHCTVNDASNLCIADFGYVQSSSPGAKNHRNTVRQRTDFISPVGEWKNGFKQ